MSQGLLSELFGLYEANLNYFVDFHAKGCHRGSSTEVASPFVKLRRPLALAGGLSLLEVDELPRHLYKIWGFNDRPACRTFKANTPVRPRPPFAFGHAAASRKGRSFKTTHRHRQIRGRTRHQASDGPEGHRNLAGERLSPFLMCWMNKTGIYYGSTFRYVL